MLEKVYEGITPQLKNLHEKIKRKNMKPKFKRKSINCKRMGSSQKLPISLIKEIRKCKRKIF
jgi:hypothetical protein